MNYDGLVTAFAGLKREAQDFPASWRTLTAQDALATALYCCRAIGYGVPMRVPLRVVMLPPDEWEQYRAQALTILEGLKPAEPEGKAS